MTWWTFLVDDQNYCPLRARNRNTANSRQLVRIVVVNMADWQECHFGRRAG